jgi:dolichol-phosphate mannosyltransferase
MMLSLVIPAHNEAGSIEAMLTSTSETLEKAGIDHELLVVDDGSTDETATIVNRLASRDPRVRYVLSPYERGFGLTVRAGLERFSGDAVAIMMGDLSDDPEDLVAYYHLLEEGYDCAFGSRFIRGSHVFGYPRLKLVLNRLANLFIRVLFQHGYNDTTNAFKAYKRDVIDTVQPLLSPHFNLTVELPLKAIVRGHTYGIVPISWTNRKEGVSKLKVQEMGSRYLFIVLYVFLERHLTRNDYARQGSTRRKRLRAGLPTEEIETTSAERR